MEHCKQIQWKFAYIFTETFTFLYQPYFFPGTTPTIFSSIILSLSKFYWNPNKGKNHFYVNKNFPLWFINNGGGGIFYKEILLAVELP